MTYRDSTYQTLHGIWPAKICPVCHQSFWCNLLRVKSSNKNITIVFKVIHRNRHLWYLQWPKCRKKDCIARLDTHFSSFMKQWSTFNSCKPFGVYFVGCCGCCRVLYSSWLDICLANVSVWHKYNTQSLDTELTLLLLSNNRNELQRSLIAVLDSYISGNFNIFNIRCSKPPIFNVHINPYKATPLISCMNESSNNCLV